jgi:eukaryotic-like serine/threonine-protein kinase
MKNHCTWLAAGALIALMGAVGCQPASRPTEAASATPALPSATVLRETATPRPTRTGIALQFASPTPGDAPASAPLRAPAWTFVTGGEIWSSPAVADGLVYFGSDDGSLYAVDVAAHTPKWKYDIGIAIRSRPAVADGVVYFTSEDNFLYALDSKSGAKLWTFDLGRKFIPRDLKVLTSDIFTSSPAVSNGIVYVGSASSNFYALDAKTGVEKWRNELMFRVRSSPAVVDGTVYFGDWNGTVHALDALTGNERWRFDTYGAVPSSPAVVDGTVYIGSKFPCLFALDALTGTQKWCFAYPDGVPWVESSAVVADGLVVVGSSDWRRVNAIEADNGDLRWFFRVEGDPWCTPAISNGVVYIGSTGGFFYALDLASGRENWRLKTGPELNTHVPDLIFGGAISSPVVVDGVVYFGSLDGKLYAVNV